MGFYVSLIFLGIILVGITLVLIVLDRKKSYEYIEGLNEKKTELSQIVNDAEQMIQELNRFSDYVVTRIDEKNEELSSNLKFLDNRLNQIASKNLDNEAKIDDGSINSMGSTDAEEEPGGSGNDLVPDNSVKSSETTENQSEKVCSAKDEQKDSPLAPRHKEILKLAESGLSDIEIAKKLNMGFGEVQLILGLSK